MANSICCHEGACDYSMPEAASNALRLHASPANEQQRVSRHRSMQLVGDVPRRSSLLLCKQHVRICAVHTHDDSADGRVIEPAPRRSTSCHGRGQVQLSVRIAHFQGSPAGVADKYSPIRCILVLQACSGRVAVQQRVHAPPVSGAQQAAGAWQQAAGAPYTFCMQYG